MEMGGKRINYPESYGRIISQITYHCQYLSDEQIIGLIKYCPPMKFSNSFSTRLPGWAFKGLLLRYGPNEKYERDAIRDFDEEKYKEKYALMEKLFSKEPPVSEILTEKEQQEIIEEVKDWGYKLFLPIYSAGSEEKDSIIFKHISGKEGLKYLVPTGSRGTDRFLRDYGVYLQLGDMDTWQINHLEKVNNGKLYDYVVKISKKDLKNIYRDNRWEGGWRTTKPIILNRGLEFNWEMFNPLMKMETFSHYEKIFGPLPNEIKNKLMEGGTKTDTD